MKHEDVKLVADTLDTMADLYLDGCAAEIRTFRSAALYLREYSRELERQRETVEMPLFLRRNVTA